VREEVDVTYVERLVVGELGKWLDSTFLAVLEDASEYCTRATLSLPLQQK
jgi:hypothetical protein